MRINSKDPFIERSRSALRRDPAFNGVRPLVQRSRGGFQWKRKHTVTLTRVLAAVAGLVPIVAFFTPVVWNSSGLGLNLMVAGITTSPLLFLLARQIEKGRFSRQSSKEVDGVLTQ